jgi:peptidoglycan/LPS O-acetylase OafA/YrhL
MKRLNLWLATRIAICIFIFICLNILISYVVLSSFSSAIVDVELDRDDVIELYYSSGTGFQPKMHADSAIIPAGKREAIRISLKDNVVRKLRVDLGRTPGSMKLYSITFKSFYGSPLVFDAQKIVDQFEAGPDIVSAEMADGYLHIQTRGNDPYYTLKGNLRLKNPFIEYLLPALFTLAIYIFFTKIAVVNWPLVQDIRGKTPSVGKGIGALDGLRGFAALTVLAEHTGVLKGLGSFGVWLFFALSGFLLARPFAQKPERAVDLEYMQHFVVRRLTRILPMYYTFLTVSMVFTGKNPELFRHFLFLQGNGHLWTIPQEVFFYMVLPFIVLAGYVLFRTSRVLMIMALSLLIVLSNVYLSVHVVSIYGYGHALKWMAGVFLSGVLCAYIYQLLLESRFSSMLDEKKLRNICSYAGLLLFAVVLVFSLKMIPGFKYIHPFYKPGLFGFLAGVFIILVMLAKETVLTRIMGNIPFRAVGVVSFSFYLIHPHMISFSRSITQYYLNFRLGGWPMFCVSGVLTFICAAFTYSMIERPFLYGSRVVEVPLPQTDEHLLSAQQHVGENLSVVRN